MPTDKVSAATAGSAAAILIVWLLGLAGIEVSPEAASAMSTLLAGLLGWAVPEGSGKRRAQRAADHAR